MIAEYLLRALLGPLEESSSLLQKIDVKLDTEAISKCRGAIKSLQRVRSSEKPDETTLKIALNSLTESSIYFESLAKRTAHEYLERTKLGAKSVKLYLKSAIRIHRRDSLEYLISPQMEFLIYHTLELLSKIGIILCMRELGYAENHINQQYLQLKPPKKQMYSQDKFFLPTATSDSLVLDWEVWGGMFLRARKKRLFPEWLSPTEEKQQEDDESNKASDFSSSFTSFLVGAAINNEVIRDAVEVYSTYFSLASSVVWSSDTTTLLYFLENRCAKCRGFGSKFRGSYEISICDSCLGVGCMKSPDDDSVFLRITKYRKVLADRTDYFYHT